MTETPEPYRRLSWLYETPSPRSSSCSGMAESSVHSQYTKSSDLVGVLEQVSELTMEDDTFNDANGLKTPVSLNPRPTACSLPMLQDEPKDMTAPTFVGHDKEAPRSSAINTPSKLLTAPPLPSSPDLSATGERRMIPPHFSPIGSSHMIDIAPLMQIRMETQDEDMMLSPPGYPPAAPPPTPQVGSLPPPMPWFETPEQTPRKKVLAHSLQMKKGPFLFQ